MQQKKMLKKATSEMLRAAPDRRGGGGRPLRTERQGANFILFFNVHCYLVLLVLFFKMLST